MAKDLFQKCRDFIPQTQFVKALGIYPFFHEIEASEGPKVRSHGKTLVMAGSNNYLGLTHHPKVKAACKAALEAYGTACSGSRFLNGNTSIHIRLEERLAQFMGKEAALILSTGFMANSGAIGSLFQEGDLIFSDADNHASIIDGCRQSRGQVIRYAHANAADCGAKIVETPCEGGLSIVTDGIFSMTGNIAPLPELLTLKATNEHLKIYVDDAHGIGVFGDHGRGIGEHFGCMDQLDLVMGTFSKSLASIGGFVAGDADVIEYLRHQARPLYFSASIPPSAAAAALAALEVIETEPEHRLSLWENVQFARKGLASLNLHIMPSVAPILAVWVGSEGKVLKLTAALREQGVFATPVIYPAVPYGHTLIRTSFMASHAHEDIEVIVRAFDAVADEFQLRRNQLPADPTTLPPGEYYNLDDLMS